ncbi:hypothetical protein KG091_04660 [Carnobacteriaceae bacterium zg-ZUI78]|nr:hypothetical protein [Carnobacteriaceae bacterium zg-ZUI78]
MKQNDLITYILHYLSRYSVSSWRVSNVSERAEIEIMFQISQKQFKVLIHDPKISLLNETYYFAVLTFEKDKGCLKGDVDTFLDYLRHMILKAKHADDEAIVFDKLLFQQYIQTRKDINRFDTFYLQYK